MHHKLVHMKKMSVTSDAHEHFSRNKPNKLSRRRRPKDHRHNSSRKVHLIVSKQLNIVMNVDRFHV